MNRVLINVEDMQLDCNCPTEVMLIAVYAHIIGSAKYFGGYYNGSVKSITRAVCKSDDELDQSIIKDLLEWLLRHDYIRLHCLNESIHFYAFEKGSCDISIWETWEVYKHEFYDYGDEEESA